VSRGAVRRKVVGGRDQLQVIAQFLEHLSRELESEEEKHLYHVVAEYCRVAANSCDQEPKVAQEGKSATRKSGVASRALSAKSGISTSRFQVPWSHPERLRP
jgi:hypothetical protein